MEIFMAKAKIKTTSSEWLLCLIAILLVLAFILPYFYVFMPTSNFKLPDNLGAWASFGSYLGGTIGPVISGLAFIGIWKTYNLQREQLQVVENQRTSEIPQHLILDAAKHIDNLLSVNVDISTIISDAKEADPRMMMEETIFFLGAIYSNEDHELYAYRDRIKTAISVEIKKIMNHLDIMARFILRYEEVSNDVMLREYYTLRYITTMGSISQTGYKIQKETSDVFRFASST
ncbi:hypothetical protein A9R10_12650 [Aeromonas piscicola]|jgi:hypothetical protein|nr:hypothetical protein A9R10_12650 [Aeromonas piscicola]